MGRDLRKDWVVSRADFEENPGEYVARHGTFRMMLYTPQIPNIQEPHSQDELYIIVRGEGRFTKAGETRSFGAGDAIFVEAGVEHQFDETSPNALVHVLFWGPEGGEEE